MSVLCWLHRSSTQFATCNGLQVLVFKAKVKRQERGIKNFRSSDFMTEAKSTELLWDARANCYSLMTALSVDKYLALVEEAYRERGGIDHQRAALKTTSAKRIRSRMVTDIQQGAVLPPIVIGVVVDEGELKEIPGQDANMTLAFLAEKKASSLAIIDGMQRTTALLDASAELDFHDGVRSAIVRIEFWIAVRTESLIYRMLVLNTGQVPWKVGKQLEVVYAPLVEEIRHKVEIPKILDNAEGERRTKAGQYKPDDLIQTYIAFGLKKTDIDTQETLADEFSRIDLTEAHSERRYDNFFYPILRILVELDCAISEHDEEFSNAENANSLKVGRHVFDKLSARIGFVVAMTVAVLGRPGMPRPEEEALSLMEARQHEATKFLERLAGMDVAELQEFLKLDLLSEKLDGQKRAAVGRYERAFFESAFKVLIEEKFEVPDLEPCWRV